MQRFDLSNPYKVKEAREYLESLIAEGAKVEIAKKRPLRSLKQNNYLYLILGWFGCEYGISVDEVKVDYFKRVVNKELFVREKVNKAGKTVKYLRSTAKLTTTEMTLAIERFRNWSSAVAEIYLPAPHEEEMLEYVKSVIERNKEFI